MGGRKNGSGRTRNGRGNGIADVIALPPGGRGGSGDPEEDAELLASVTEFASQGLDMEEILARLRLPAPPPGQEGAWEAALERGRRLGRAAIKRAQYRAAMEGRVGAQAQVLARLGAGPPAPAEVEEPVPEVERVIVRKQEDDDRTD